MIVGLKGFTKRGRIDGYFTSGWFPDVFNWTSDHLPYVHIEYTKQFGNTLYLPVAFSDGGTVAHDLAAIDPRCIGLIVHSGVFRKSGFIPRKIPILLLVTNGDRTPMPRHTVHAYHWYKSNGIDVTIEFLDPCPTKQLNHQFANGLPAMYRWCKEKLNYELPIAYNHLPRFMENTTW